MPRSRRRSLPLPAQAEQTQQAKPSDEERESGRKRYLVDRDAGNLTLAVASAPVNDLKEIESAQISECGQRYCVEATSEVYVACKRYKAAQRARSVRINQELEKRIGLIVLSGYLDRILRTHNRLERESRCLSRYVGIELDSPLVRDERSSAG